MILEVMGSQWSWWRNRGDAVREAVFYQALDQVGGGTLDQLELAKKCE